MAFDNTWLIQLWMFLQQQSKYLTLILLLSIGGRVLFLLILFGYLAVLKKETPTQKIEAPYFWPRLIARELFYFLIGFISNYTAIFIFSYSLISAGTYLKKYDTHLGEKKGIKKITKGLGIFFTFIVPPLAILTFILLIFVFGNIKLYYEFAMVSVATFIALIKQQKFSTTASLVEFFQQKDMFIWKKMSKGTKVASILILLAIPVTLYGLFYNQVIAGTWDFNVEMRDGTKLRTRVYFPRNWHGEALPIIMSRTPYNIDGLWSMAKSYQIDYGYRCIVVFQDLRGEYHSQGDFLMFRSDYTDGVDTVNWLMNQSWCNGKIASVGGSAVCCNQYYYHAEGPTGMKAASLMAGTPELYDYWFMPGGCIRKEFDEKWLTAVGAADQYTLMLEHPMKDDFWRSTSLLMNERYKNVAVRALHIGGWYDCFAQGTIDGFGYYNYNASEYARGHQIMVLGPWSHGIGSRFHPNMTYPENANEGVTYWNNAEQFIFNDTLFGIEQNWANQPRVYYYVMGDPESKDPDVNQWHTSMDWPLQNMTYQPWYLHSNGTFSPIIPSSTANVSYNYDPTKPVSSMGGTTLFTENGLIGAMDQRPVEDSRNDIISFTTDTLGSPVEIVGRVWGCLTVASNCTDTDFVVKLMDVFPDGQKMWVADGILKARYRNGYNCTNLLVPGQSYDLMVDMWSTGYRFVSGHKILVSVTSSNYPKFAVNPNTGGVVLPNIGSSGYYIANNIITCGGVDASYIWFPRTN